MKVAFNGILKYLGGPTGCFIYLCHSQVVSRNKLFLILKMYYRYLADLVVQHEYTIIIVRISVKSVHSYKKEKIRAQEQAQINLAILSMLRSRLWWQERS